MFAILKKAQSFLQERTSLLVWAVIVLVCLALISSYLILLLSSLNNIKEEVVAIHLEIAQGSKNKIEGFLDENIRTLNDLAQILSVIKSDEERKRIIDRFLKERKDFAQITIVNNQGREVLKSSRFLVFTPEIPKDFSLSESFTAPREGGIYLSAVYASEKSDPFLTLGLAIRPSPDQISGVLLAELSLRKIWDIISEIKVGSAGLVYLVDSKGYLIAHPDIQIVLKKTNLLQRQAVEKVIIGKKIVYGLDKEDQYLNEKGEMVYVAGLPLKRTGWGIFVENPMKDAFTAYRAIRNLGLISILAAMGLFGLLSVSVQAQTKALSNLKKSETALHQKTDELEEAKIGLEIKVAARTQELKELTAGLEKKVKERTKELQAKIDELERFHRLTVGREMTMIELKKEIKKLKQELEDKKIV